MEKKPTSKYPTNAFYRFPFVLGGVFLVLGGAFLLRKSVVLDNEEARKMMYRPEDENANKQLLAFKKEFNK